MPIQFTCGACGKAYKAADADAGKKVACKNCKSTIVIPKEPATALVTAMPPPLEPDYSPDEVAPPPLERAEFRCPKCNMVVSAPISLVGKSCDCPRCGEEVECWPAPTMLVSRSAAPKNNEPAVWFYSVNEQQRGPVSESQLRAMIEAGMLRPSDHVWKEGMPEWVELQTAPGLLPRTMVKPPPVPKVSLAKVKRLDNDAAEARSVETQDCPFCASPIPVKAKICRQCGETVDVALRAAEEAKREA